MSAVAAGAAERGSEQPPAEASPAGDSVATYEEFRATKYFPALDGLRAIAILMVFTAHPDDQRWLKHIHGGNGVTVFFVLSGFLITTLSLREEDRRGRLDVRSFFIRRFFRIAPVYILVLAFYTLCVLLLHFQPERHDAYVNQLPYYIFGFPEHGHFFIANQAITPPFEGAWSIGIEEKFYVLWPLVGFIALAGLFARRVWLCVIVGTACALAPVLFRDGAYAEPYVHIFIGCVVALIAHDRRTFKWARRLASWPAFAASVIAFVLVQTVLWPANPDHARQVYALSGLITGFAMFGIALRTKGIVKGLTWRPVVFLGEISYVFYLVHGFMINSVESSRLTDPARPEGVLVVIAVALPLAIVASYVIHRWVERPLISVGRRLGHRDATRMHSV